LQSVKITTFTDGDHGGPKLAIFNTVPTLDHCALIIFFGAMETRNEYFATLEIGVRKRVRKRKLFR